MSIGTRSDSIIQLPGKNAFVMGVADQESLAWAIARSLKRSGAQVTVGYQQKFYSRVRKLLDEEPGIEARRCDILNADEMEEFFRGSKIDVLVHSIAYGPAEAFIEPPSKVTAQDFAETLEISAHSLAKTIRFARPHLSPGASVMTLSFQAAQRAMPMYGMMGVAKSALESLVRYLAMEVGSDRIRINAISAGPVETLAALFEIVAFKRNPQALERLPGRLMREVIDQLPPGGTDEDELAFARRCWKRLQEEFAARSPIPEPLFAADIADTALFLASDLSRKITGQVIHVDCGFSSCMLL